MSDISTYLQQILTAIYGEDVRSAIYNSITAMKSDLDTAIAEDLNPLAFRGDLPSGTSLDLYNGQGTNAEDMAQRGIWRLLQSSTYTGLPSDFDHAGAPGYLIIYINGSNCVQELHYYGGGDNKPITSWTRVYDTTAASFGPWVKGVEKTRITYNYGASETASITSCDDVTWDSTYFAGINASGIHSISDFPISGPGWLITKTDGANIVNKQIYQIVLPWSNSDPIKCRTAHFDVWTGWYTFKSDEYNNKLGALYENNPMGILVHNRLTSNATQDGVTVSYDLDKEAYHIIGTPTAQPCFHNIWYSFTSLMDGLEAGKKYNFFLKADENVVVDIFVNRSSVTPSFEVIYVISSGVLTSITIPSDAIGFLIRFRFPNAVVMDTYASIEMMPGDEYTTTMLNYYIENRMCSIGSYPLSAVLDNSCDDVNTSCVIFHSVNGTRRTFSDFPLDDAGYLQTYKFIAVNGSSNSLQIAYGWESGMAKIRTCHFGTWTDWRNLGTDTNYLFLSSCDLNDLVHNDGFYLLVDSETYDNKPLSSLTTGFLDVRTNTNWTLQIYYELRGDRVWKRTLEPGGTVNPWVLAGGGSGNVYNITQQITRDNISNVYNSTISPTITTDANGWLLAVDNESTSEANATDMTSAIMAMLNSTGYCHLGVGTYYVSGNINMPVGSTLVGCGEKTIIRLLSSVSSGYTVRIYQYATIKDICFSGGKNYPTNLYTQDDDMGSRHCIYCIGNADGTETTQPSKTVNMISNCWIQNYDGSGFYAHNVGGGLNQGDIVEGCHIEHCRVGINIDHWYEYAKFTDCIIFQCYYACINNGGNNVFNGCTFHGVVGMLFDNSGNDKPNIAHGTIIGCTFNHIDNMNNPTVLGNGTALHIINCSPGEIITGCQFWYGNIIVENSQAIAFSDNLFGNNAISIKVTGSYPVFFHNNMFFNTPTLDVNSSTVFTNNYHKNGTLIVP